MDNNIYKLKRIEKKKDDLVKYQNIISNNSVNGNKLNYWEVEKYKELAGKIGAPKAVKFADWNFLIL